MNHDSVELTVSVGGIDDWRLLRRVPGRVQTHRLDHVERSLDRALAALRDGRTTHLYVGLAIGPPEDVVMGTIKARRFDRKAEALEIKLGFDSTMPDDEVGPRWGQLSKEGIEFGLEALAKRKLFFDGTAAIARIDRWLANEEWLELAPASPPGGWPERLEIHVEMTQAWNIPFADSELAAIEWHGDKILEGLGAFWANDVRADEWVTYFDCLDGAGVLERLRPMIEALRAPGFVYVLMGKRDGPMTRVDIKGTAR